MTFEQFKKDFCTGWNYFAKSWPMLFKAPAAMWWVIVGIGFAGIFILAPLALLLIPKPNLGFDMPKLGEYLFLIPPAITKLVLLFFTIALIYLTINFLFASTRMASEYLGHRQKTPFQPRDFYSFLTFRMALTYCKNMFLFLLIPLLLMGLVVGPFAIFTQDSLFHQTTVPTVSNLLGSNTLTRFIAITAIILLSFVILKLLIVFMFFGSILHFILPLKMENEADKKLKPSLKFIYHNAVKLFPVSVTMFVGYATQCFLIMLPLTAVAAITAAQVYWAEKK